MAVLLIIITLLLMLIVTILSIPLAYTVRLYITSPFKATATVNWSGRVFLLSFRYVLGKAPLLRLYIKKVRHRSPPAEPDINPDSELLKNDDEKNETDEVERAVQKTERDEEDSGSTAKEGSQTRVPLRPLLLNQAFPLANFHCKRYYRHRQSSRNGNLSRMALCDYPAKCSRTAIQLFGKRV